MAGAPRLLSSAWQRRTRGAGFMLGLWLAASGAVAQTITAAAYGGPTTRYAHAVLGDAVEHTTLTVTLSNGTRQSLRWDAPLVFEDTEPRLADVDGDGMSDVIVVETHADRGARLAVYGLRDGRLAALGQTDFIGTPFRWLAPVGVADLDGDGATEIAYVDRPHLARVLRILRVLPLPDGRLRLTQVAQQAGLTNHRIGWDFIAGGIRVCDDGPVMILADADWSRTMAVTFRNGVLRAQALADVAQPSDLSRALTCPD